MSDEIEVTETNKTSEVGSTIPELTMEEQYPAQGAYVGFLLTDILSTRLGMRLADVELIDGCLFFEMEVFLHDEDGEVVDTDTFNVSFHKGTIALVCPTEEWWPRMEGSAIFGNLYDIAAHCGCLIALSAIDTNAASVRDPEIDALLQEKGAIVHAAPSSLN
jgi:hypothetical protein